MCQGLTVQARDGASRTELDAVIACAMAAWDTLTRADWSAAMPERCETSRNTH